MVFLRTRPMLKEERGSCCPVSRGREYEVKRAETVLERVTLTLEKQKRE